MRLLSSFKLLGVAVVLIALLTAVGGLVISQAAGAGQSNVKRSNVQRQRPWTLDFGPL